MCTIYHGDLPSENEARSARMALMMFNDVILRTAVEHGLDVIDLRSVCTQAAHYANAIEPSGTGGARIASAIAAALGITQAPEVRRGQVFALSR